MFFIIDIFEKMTPDKDDRRWMDGLKLLLHQPGVGSAL